MMQGKDEKDTTNTSEGNAAKEKDTTWGPCSKHLGIDRV
jgi:hypothetical protein